MSAISLGSAKRPMGVRFLHSAALILPDSEPSLISVAMYCCATNRVQISSETQRSKGHQIDVLQAKEC